jgi:hypothetical protein
VVNNVWNKKTLQPQEEGILYVSSGAGTVLFEVGPELHGLSVSSICY